MAVASSPTYFDWLRSQIEVTGRRRRWFQYEWLHEKLFTREFTWHIHNDDNRVVDGLALRDEYMEQFGMTPSVHILECSMLEMMIGLARRASYEDDRTPAEWFHQFLFNLGIDRANDHNVVESRDWYEFRIHLIMTTVIDRTYSYDGQGGLFPLVNPHEDQTQVELWYQMSAYLLENSPV